MVVGLVLIVGFLLGGQTALTVEVWLKPKKYAKQIIERLQ